MVIALAPIPVLPKFDSVLGVTLGLGLLVLYSALRVFCCGFSVFPFDLICFESV